MVAECPICSVEASSGATPEGCTYCLLQLGLSSSAWSSRLNGSSRGGAAESPGKLELEGVLSRFGDYELLSEIARGGMGVVYRARQRSLDRLVAVKMILAGQLATRESLERFRLEAKAAAGLHHPGIVPIYEIGEYETQHFFSMELIDGPSLAECLTDFSVDPQARQSEQRAQQRCIAELLAGVARALDFAHQHGVLHRDLKPSNILIDPQGRPHLTDFGLAKLTGRELSGLTLSHAVLGTPGYLAPEQAAGHEDITIAADVYGLGATLYELLTGRPPFVGATAVETMWMAVDRTPTPARQINPALHRDLETIASRCLEKRPAQRYRSAVAVAEELERFARGEPIMARPVSTPEHVTRWCTRNPWLATLAAALMLTFLVGSATAFWQWSRAERANVSLRENVAHLEWDAIDELLQRRQTSTALARVASMLRDDATNWKAAMFGISVLEHHSFPVPAAPPIRHPEGTDLTVARISPNGLLIATASLDGTARVWNAKTSEQIFPELRHQAAVNWVEFSPDGKLLATCSGKLAQLWDLETGHAAGEPLLHPDGVVSVHYSPHGRFLLTRTDQNVSVWDVFRGDLSLGPLAHEGRVATAGFLADGKCVFSAQQAGEDSLVRAWNVETGEQLVELKTGPLIAADLNDDLSRAVTVSIKKACVWDVISGRKLQEIGSDNRWRPYVLFSTTGNRFVTVDSTDLARVWDTETGLPITSELSHYYFLNGVAFLGGDRLLTWADDSTAQVWDATTGEPTFETIRHANRVQYVETGVLDGEEVFLATMSHRHTLTLGANRTNVIKRSESIKTGAAQLWRVHGRSKTARRVIAGDPNAFNGSKFSPDGQQLAICNTSQKVLVLRTASLEPICDPLPTKGEVWSYFFTPDGERLITTTASGQVAIWSLPDGKLLLDPVELPTTIQPAEIATDGRHFATGSTDGFLRLWDTTTGRPVLEMNHGAEINSVGISPDGRRIASAGEDRITKIWNAHTGEIIQELKGHENEVMSVAFHSDGRRVVTASPDFTARIWDVETGQQLHLLRHQGEVIDALFSPDGRLVACGGRDRTATIWNADTGRPHVRNLLHKQAVKNVLFSPDGQRLLTRDFRGLRQWDVASGHPLTVHLPQDTYTGLGFQCSSTRPAFSPDGESVLVSDNSQEAILWHIPPAPSGTPLWLPEFFEAVGGQRIVAGTDSPEIVPSTDFLNLRERLLGSTNTDSYIRWARQWLLEVHRRDDL